MKIDEVLNSNFKSAQIRASVNLKYTSNYFSAGQNAFMAKYGLSMPQFNILRILRGAGEMISVNTVKDRMVEKSPNTTRLMDKLVEKDLIKRDRCNDDRRVVFVEISKKGLDVLGQIDEALKVNSVFPTNLTDEEAELLSDLLDKMRG